MKIANLIFLIIMILVSGCAKGTIHLIDGRSFTVEAVYNDGIRLQFRTEGWSYNLPSYFLSSDKPTKSIVINRVKVLSDTIVTTDGELENFEGLMHYLDEKATRTSPVIVELVNAVSWTEERRQDFGKSYGEVEKRPYVGLEVPWPKK